MFSFKSISLLLTQLLVPSLTNYFNCYFSLHSLYSSDLQTIIVLFSRNVSSHKTDWLLSKPHNFTQDWPHFYWISRVIFTHYWLNSNLISRIVFTLSCLFYHKCQQSDECIWKRMSAPSRNLYKCKQADYCAFCLSSSVQSCCYVFTYLSAFLYCLFTFGVSFYTSTSV